MTIDVQGAEIARKVYPEAVGVFILPPTREALESRLTTRASEAAESRQLRLQNARYELAQFRHFDYIVINDDLERSTEELIAIVRAERCRTRRLKSFAENLSREFAE
jgi:guanylate kinase